MKKTWVLLFAVALVMVGCSQDGDLKVYNETSSYVSFTLNNGEEIELDYSEYFTKSWSLASSIFGNEEKDIDVNYTGDYVFSDDTTVTVEAGKTKKLRIYPDAGIASIWNNSSSFYIEELYLSPSSSSNWGDNLIPYTSIDPGETDDWKVSEGYWDVQLVDDWGDVFESYENWISVDETTIFEYTGFKKADHAAGGEKPSSTTNQTRNEGRIEHTNK